MTGRPERSLRRPLGVSVAGMRWAQGARRGRGRDHREPGQILVLFVFAVIVLLLFASIAIDLGLLRNNRQTLVNAVDAGALAGGTMMPVDGSDTSVNAQGRTPLAETEFRIRSTLLATYPGLPNGAFSISYKCLIGVDANAQPYISRDIPLACDPHFSMGRQPVASDFQGAGATRFSSCDPFRGDMCNTVVVSANVATNYSFGRVVGVNEGWTGVVQSAACNGPCGQSPTVPVDLVVLMDRTASMSSTQLTDARNAAKAVLGIYDPAVQRVAFGLLGPSQPNTTCAGTGGPSVSANAINSSAPAAPTYRTAGTGANSSSGVTNLDVSKPSGVANSDVLVAGITFSGGNNITITPPAGWTLIRRTNNSTNLGVATYYKVVTNAGSEPGSQYTWTLSPSARAAGGILRYSGVDPADPVNISAGQNGSDTSSPFQPVAPSMTTTGPRTAIVAFLAMGTGTTFSSPSNGTTERFDVRNSSSSGPTITAVNKTQSGVGSTGSTNSSAGAGGQWAAQHVALNRDVTNHYGATYPNDLAKWVPIGFTGTDTGTPGPRYSEAYVDGSGTLQNNTHIVSAINCFNNPGGTGTNLTTPLRMAAAYLQQYGRPYARWGIILETDGQPNYGSTGDPGNYTCASAVAAATFAKGITNAQGQPIELYTVGFLDVGSDPDCPDSSGTYQSRNVTYALSHMASSNVTPSPNGSANGCVASENTDQDHFFCQPKSEDLGAVFRVIATDFAGLRSHLVQLYPVPYVSGIGPTAGTHLGGATVTITGRYFSGATRVTFGGASATNVIVVSDSEIRVTTPAGADGSTVHVIVTTPGGSSPLVPGDRYTYN